MNMLNDNSSPDSEEKVIYKAESGKKSPVSEIKEIREDTDKDVKTYTILFDSSTGIQQPGTMDEIAKQLRQHLQTMITTLDCQADVPGLYNKPKVTAEENAKRITVKMKGSGTLLARIATSLASFGMLDKQIADHIILEDLKSANRTAGEAGLVRATPEFTRKTHEKVLKYIINYPSPVNEIIEKIPTGNASPTEEKSTFIIRFDPHNTIDPNSMKEHLHGGTITHSADAITLTTTSDLNEILEALVKAKSLPQFIADSVAEEANTARKASYEPHFMQAVQNNPESSSIAR